MTLTRSPLLLALAALAPACGTFSDTSESAGSDETASGSGSDSDTPTGGEPGDTVTVYDIQQGKVPVDLVVQLNNVIATSPVYFDKNKKAFLFVAEAAGGPFSGIQVYIYDDVAVELGAGLPKMGDTLSLRATYTEFFDLSQLTVTAASDVTITGPGTIPPPASSRPPRSPPWAPRPRTTRAAWSRSSAPRSPPRSSSSASSRSTAPSRSTTCSSSPPPAPSPRWAPSSPPSSAR
jgi:hypothetical protein